MLNIFKFNRKGIRATFETTPTFNFEAVLKLNNIYISTRETT